MSILERLELGTIAVLTVTIWFSAPLLPFHIRVANLVLLLAGLLLLQSLIRDLSILLIQRKYFHTTPRRAARCMCVESTIGATGVLLGVGLIGLGVSSTVTMGQIPWTVAGFATTVIGFLIRDLVIQWSPWEVRREKDHLNIIFSWKTQDP